MKISGQGKGFWLAAAGLSGVLLLALFWIVALPAREGRIAAEGENLGEVAETAHAGAEAERLDFAFAGLDGGRQSFSDMRRPVVLVHFWASWCAPCVVEFPQLMELAAKYGGNVDLMLVSLDRDVAAIEAFRAKIKDKNPDIRLDGPNLHWIWDEGKNISLKTFNTVKVPETFFFGPDRRIVDKKAGETDWNSPPVAALIDGMLAAPQ